MGHHMVCYLRAVGGRASGGIGRLALPAGLSGGFWNMRHTDRKASADSLRACTLCVTWALFVLPKLRVVLHGKPIADHGSDLDRILNHGLLECLRCSTNFGGAIGGALFARGRDWSLRAPGFIPSRITYF